MKKENDEMLIITEDELEVIIQPNDVLTKNMETLVYGGGPGGPAGVPGCFIEICGCDNQAPPGKPGA